MSDPRDFKGFSIRSFPEMLSQAAKASPSVPSNPPMSDASTIDPAAILKRVDETEKDVREQLKLGSHIKGVRPPSSVLINPDWLLFLCTILRTALADTLRVEKLAACPYVEFASTRNSTVRLWREDASKFREALDVILPDAAMAATPREK